MQRGFVRIIAGKWRGRRLRVPEIKGLRPTPDRVRETLFNWLSPYIHHAHCLDAFAGTGVLGFEALSRGAAQVVMVDHSAEVISLLKKELIEFKAENATIFQTSVEHLQVGAKKFDIVFLDPPYADQLLISTCHVLEDRGFLADSAYIYLESGEKIDESLLPSTWHVTKAARAGQVYYYLALREGIRKGKS